MWRDCGAYNHAVPGRIAVVDDEDNIRETVAFALRREGYDVDIEPDEDEGEWIAYVTRTARPEVGDVVRIQEQTAALAGAHGGAYEGWNLVPPEQGDEVTHDVEWELPD